MEQGQPKRQLAGHYPTFEGLYRVQCHHTRLPLSLLTEGKDGVPAVQVAVPEGQNLAAPSGQDGGKDGVLEHEVDGVDEALGLRRDLLLQAPNAGLEKDIGDPCRGKASSRLLQGWEEWGTAGVRGRTPLPSRAKR